MNVRLVAYRGKGVVSGVVMGGNYAATSTSTGLMSTTGTSPSTAFSVGDTVVNSADQVLGVVIQTGASAFQLGSLSVALSTGEAIFLMKENAYELELQENPSISLNFQFSDVKEPEKRKASYSQTFKLPFTDDNNAFFQNWFGVNLETLNFSTRKKFNAVLYVGTVPQFEGIIQLNSVYQKAQLYEVMLLSNTGDLFSVIGNKKLRDVFKNEDGSYSFELNHTFSIQNIEKSWDGSDATFYAINEDGSQGASLRDATAGVQKVMYPLSVTRPSFFYDGSNSNRYLAMNNPGAYELDEALDKMVDITQFRPSIQIKELIKLIIAKAGFSYTSNFIDGAYFGKLYTTSCNHITIPTSPTIGSGGDVDGFMDVGTTNNNWGNYNTLAGATQSCSDSEFFSIIPANQTTPISTNFTLPSDNGGLWNTTSNYFTKLDVNMTEVTFGFTYSLANIASCNDEGTITFYSRVQRYDTTTNSIDWDTMYAYGNGIVSSCESTGGCSNIYFERSLPLANMPIGQSAVLVVKPLSWTKANNALASTLLFGTSAINANGLYSQINITWVGYGTNIYGKVVDVPSCIDEKMTQKAFLKDIIERFNLVVIADPDNASNIIIEPYKDFIGSGDLKYWTDKLDLDKEIIVKDTTSLQKKTLLLSDLEDVDLANKSVKDEFPDYNVYGKIDIQETNNDFANGVMKNNPIFSPFINERVFRNENDQLITLLRNVAVQYEYTYKKTETGYDNTLEATKPKLFYYSGVASTIQEATGSDNIYFHRVNTAVTPNTILAITINQFPLCTPYELSTSGGDEATLTASTKSLYWSQAPPICGDLNCFNYSPNSVVSLNSLYYTYWEDYLNQIYSPDARIMECHLNLDAVDIFNFSFADEIFIKDTYWRVLEISNYQVGAKASTKVTLIKSAEMYSASCPDCGYVVGEFNGNNTYGPFYVWCSAQNPGCTPDITSGGGYIGLFADVPSCIGAGGTPFYWWSAYAESGLYPCLANTGSLPINIETIYGTRSIFSSGGLKGLISGKVNGRNTPLVIGNDTTKYSEAILPYYGNDIVVKYNTRPKTKPQLNGESHRIALTGLTEGNTRGYAYVQGDSSEKKLLLPYNTITAIRVTGIVTVIGGSSSTYTLGKTEAFAYYTAFKNFRGAITQLSTAGGQQEFSMREGANPTTCTLYITTNNYELQFGLDDSQTDTKRVWALTVELDINRVESLELPYNENWALFQNGQNIQLQNGEYLIWN